MEKHMKWMIRHGFLPGGETGITGQWLGQTLANLIRQGQSWEQLSEQQWMDVLAHAAKQIDTYFDVPGRESLIDPTANELPLIQIDPYVRGIVRWLNMMHMYTICSCDGEGKRPAVIYFLDDLSAEQRTIIRACAPKRVKVHFSERHPRYAKLSLHYNPDHIDDLLVMAERLYDVWRNPDRLLDYRLETFQQRLLPLLAINGPSGRERSIRAHLQRMLRKKTDELTVDPYGNLLAIVRRGDGPTILLSAHLDTVRPFPLQRTIVHKGTTWRASSGILGADDRAGIAVILELLDSVPCSRFSGTLKIAFTVEEEIGCLGSRHLDPDFLRDVDAAIVVDRRGTRDIVTSNGGTPFCPDEYGRLFEQAGALAGMPDWRTTAGGVSDAKVFASFGIPSVNLSVGYENEHTEDESLNVRATLETVMLLEKVFDENLLTSFVQTEVIRPS
ncbi:M20/M25/M40 family metallo-hydrolase [Geobacillus sp. BK01]|uniref:M20/M25/M40 family metallo-hydrolase n=1 Tax=Geobacillus sp. BK01 TaxID=3457328 RepID=UPI003FA5F0E9